jgi:hypothetical protein
MPTIIEGDRRINFPQPATVEPPPPPPPPPPPASPPPSEYTTDGVDPVKPGLNLYPEQAPAGSNPRTALDQIRQLPAPTWAGIPTSFSPEDRQAQYDARVDDYHRQRLEIASGALHDAQPPRPEDFRSSGLNAATADSEYRAARESHDQKIAELETIVGESDRHLAPPQPLSGRDNMALAALGVKMSPQPSSEELRGAREILKKLSRDTLDELYTAGQELTFGQQFQVAPHREVGVEVSTELGRVESRPGTDDTGKHQVDKSQKLTVELEVTAGVKVDNQDWRAELDHMIRDPGTSPAARKLAQGARVVDISAEHKGGARLTVEAKVTTEQGRKIADGELDVPNPFDPRSMAPGTAVLIKGQALEKASLDVGYRFFQAESQVNQLSGTGVGVEKLKDNRVRVTIGPVDTIENETFLGPGTRQVRAGVSQETKLEDSSMRMAEFDLSSAEGENAYRAFLLSMNVPPPGTPGVTRTGRVETQTVDGKLAAELKLGDLGGKVELTATTAEKQSTIWSDGSREETIFWRRKDDQHDRALSISRTLNAEGEVDPGKTRYSIVDVNARPSIAINAGTAFGTVDGRPGNDRPQDVQVVLDRQQMLEIRDRARGYLQREPAAGPLIQSLAAAEDVDQVAVALAQHDHAFEGLLALAKEPERPPLAGTVTMQPGG